MIVEALLVGLLSIQAPSPPVCMPYEDAKKKVAEFGQTLKGRGIQEGSALVYELYVNDESGSFSIIGVNPYARACVFAFGPYWETYKPRVW